MKKYLSLIVSMIALVSCQAEKLVEAPSVSKEEYMAFTEMDKYTKTSMDQDFNVIWSEGDEVSIFEGSAVNQKYRTKTYGSTSTEMEFVGGSSFVAGTEIASNVAVYPYSSELSIKKSGDKYTVSNVVIPETQMYAESSFGKGVAPMVAVTSSTSDKVLKFKNAFGGVNLQLVGTDKIKSITLSGNNGEVICGAANVSVSNAVVPEITMTGTGTAITLECGEGVQLNESTPTPFYIVLPPVVMENGFTAVVTNFEGNSMTLSSTKIQSVSRNTMLNMPTVSYEAEIDESTIPLTFKAINDDAIIGLVKHGNPWGASLEYAINNGEWQDYSIGQNLMINKGDIISFRNKFDHSAFSSSYYNYYSFYMAGGDIEASGNVSSLVDKTMESQESGCLAYLFSDCTNLVKAPLLPATVMSNYGYYCMFKNCKKLKNTPSLPATTLAYECYLDMFADCSNLTEVTELPATSLAESCYTEMFRNCTSLVNVPSDFLPATTLARSCYQGMFDGCSSLSSAPELKATSLAEDCYLNMFYGCSSLSSAPELKATSLASNCYGGMFGDCIGLTKCPELPAKVLVEGCYGGMFYGCSNIKEAPELNASIMAKWCYNEMFGGCTSLVNAPLLSSKYLAEYCYSGMFSGCTSLVNAPELPASILKKNCYRNMFSGCTSLETAPELSAPTLAEYCYSGMFSDCTSLLNAPELPAPTLAEYCYNSMFSGCTSLETAPELPAPTLAEYCYNSMFGGCTSLVNAPELPASTLEKYCYRNMFSGCTSLETAPELSAPTLAEYCYNSMFSGCTSLVNAPELPAPTLAEYCYNSMFSGCSSLVVSPDLLATELPDGCYSRMFNGCTNLKYIKMMGVNIGSSSLYYFTYKVGSGGTFVKNRLATWNSNTDKYIVPSSWKIIYE